MASNTTEQDSDDSFYKSRRKTRRQRVSSFSSDDSVVAQPHRRKKCRVSSSSSDSDDSLLARPSRKKCKVLDSGSESTATTDSEEEEIFQRQQQRRPKKNAVVSVSDSEPTPDKGSAVTNNSVTADLNSSDSDEGEKCIICFKSLKPPFGNPSNCSHHFHPKCLATWSKTSNTCPIDRVKYTAIRVVDHKGDLVSREGVTTPPPQDHNADFEPDDTTFCEVCSQHDREHEMLLCDRCEAGYHLDCLSPPLREVPDGNWFCPICSELGNELAAEMNVLMDDAAIILESRMRQRSDTSAGMPSRPRTRGAQRVFNIIHHQQSADQPSTSSVTIRRQRTSSHRARRSKSNRRPQSTRYKVELITVEDGTTLEVKVAVNTRTRTKSKKHSRRKSKKKCSKSNHKSGGPSTSRDAIFTGEGPSRSLDLFGSRPQLDYFSGCEAEDELDEDGGRGGGVAALRCPRPGIRNMASRKQIAAQILNSRPRRPVPTRIEVSRAPVDLVSSIIEQQEKWHSPGASYESASNGDIRVIMKERSSKMRQAGGSSGGSSSNAPSTSAQTSSSSSRSSRDIGSSGGGSAGGSRETSNAPQPSSAPSSRICDEDSSKTSGSSEWVPSPKMSSPSDMDSEEKDKDEVSLCEKARGKLDPDIPLQPSPHNPSLLGNSEEENCEPVDKNDASDERSPSQLPYPIELQDVSQQGSSADEEPECPIQGIYSKISQQIAVSRNDSEHSDNDDETPPADSGSVNSATDPPFDDQRVPEDLSMKKTSHCEEKVESNIKEDKCLDIATESKNEVECNKQVAAYEEDGRNKQECDDKPEDLTMVDSDTRGRKETGVQECENDNEEGEWDSEQDNSSLGTIVKSKDAVIRKSTDGVGGDEEYVADEKDDATRQEVDEGQDECDSEDFTAKNDFDVQKIAEKQDVDQTIEAEIPIAAKKQDIDQTTEAEIPIAAEKQDINQTTEAEIPIAPEKQDIDQTTEAEIPIAPEKQDIDQTTEAEIPIAPEKQDIDQTTEAEIPIAAEKKYTDQTTEAEIPTVAEKQDIGQTTEVEEAEIPVAHNDAVVRNDYADATGDDNDADGRYDDDDVVGIPCISDVTPEGMTIEPEVGVEKVPTTDDLSSSTSVVGNDDVPNDTKNAFIDDNLSELSDGELADEITEEGPPYENCDSKSKHFEKDRTSSCTSNANLDDKLSKDDLDNAGDRIHQLRCSSNEHQEINYSESEIFAPDVNDSQHEDPVAKTSEDKGELDSCTKISTSENDREAQVEQGDLLEIGCEEEKDGLVDITDEEISSYERSWEMEENGEKNKKEGLEGLETEAISDCESQPVDPDVSQRKENDESLEFQPSNEVIEEASKEEEGEIVTEESSPVQMKKTSKERNYRGDTKTKDKKKDSLQNNDKQSELERYEVRRVITEKPRQKSDFRRDISSDTESTSLSSSIGRSISRDKMSRSKSRSRSRGRVKEKRDWARDRSREHSKSRSRDRNKVRSISREKNRRNRSRDRQSRSRSRKRRRSRTPRRDRGRLRGRGSRERRKRKRSPSSSCSSCSCSSCERNKKRNKKLTVIVPNEGKNRERSRDRGKNKKDKRRSRSRNRKRRTPVPSKEVFTSGNNILVSVNFKSSNAEESARTAETAPPGKRKKDDEVRKKKDKRTKENQSVRSIVTKKNTSRRRKINTSNMKPVAIIDLDASPFRETTLSPKEVIILTDSDDEDKLARTESAMQMSGPKTPPEPHIKFSIANNSKQQQQLRGIPNPLMDKAGREDDDVIHIGPNTPPEPSAAYDPFEPTKSRSPSPGLTSRSDRIPSPQSDAKQRHSPLQSQISMTPPKLSQHDSPKTPSPLQSMPKDMDDMPDKNKQLPFQPAGLDSGDDSGGGGGGDSPYSPGSSEGDDLFEPPMPQSASVSKPRPRPVVASQSNKSKVPPSKVTMNIQKRPNINKEASKKGPAKKDIGMKLDEDQMKILDDLPNSAVEMQFLKKLNRQERVVEEVKLVLKPHFAKKHVSKEEYKEILRRSVPKICHSRSGEINPMKIQRLVEAYVKKYRHRMKRKGGAPAIPPLRQNKPVVVKTQWA